MVGCGNSKLSQDLYDVGCHQITNIDISKLVIEQMNDTNKNRPTMSYVHMDATQMAFDADRFSVVLDKGTLDALFTDDTDDTQAIVHKYFAEIARVLRTGGRYVCISLLQEHIIRKLVDFFPRQHFMLRVVRCLEAEQKTAEASSDGTAMPVFFVVVTKFQKLPFAVLEVCMSGDKMSRLQSTGDVVEAVLSVQKAALVCNGLHRGSIADMNEVSMDLFRPDEQIPRFTVHILDQRPKRGNGKFAIFIVPQGRWVPLNKGAIDLGIINLILLGRPNGYSQRHRVARSCWPAPITTAWPLCRCIAAKSIRHGRMSSLSCPRASRIWRRMVWRIR